MSKFNRKQLIYLTVAVGLVVATAIILFIRANQPLVSQVSAAASPDCAEMPVDTAVTGESLAEYRGPYIAPLELDDQGRVVDFPWMDEEEDEDLIIKSNCRTYTSFTSSLVYFAVSGKSDESESIELQFYLPRELSSVIGREVAVRAVEQDMGGIWEPRALWAGSIDYGSRIKQAYLKKKSVPMELEAKTRLSFKLEAGSTAYFRAEIAYPPGSEGQFMIEAFGSGGSYGLLDPWFNSNWTHRKKIIVNHQKVAGTSNLSNFPMLVNSTDLDFRTVANGGKVGKSDGTDILFTSSDGTTQLDHEIEKYTNITGELIAWVEISTLDYDDNTVIYMYYGNAAAADQQDITGVWDSNYKGVWHLNEGDSTAANFYEDSTTTPANGTLTDADADTATITGQVDGAMDFNGDADYIDMGNPAKLQIAGSLTLSAWVNLDDYDATRNRIIQKMGLAGDRGYELSLDDNASNNLTMVVSSTGSDWVSRYQTAQFPTGQWVYVAGVFDASGQTITVYRDGASITTTLSGTVPTTLFNTSATVRIADRTNTGAPMDGKIDEVRISSAARSADWIATEYNNQFSPGTFYGVGGQEAKTPTTPGVKFK